jgi:hypothetical protein
MTGPAGDFYNATWPGYVGALTAMAPGRFAAAINQAPLRRRTADRRLRVLDIALNAVGTYLNVRAVPPDQLLRKVMETCRDFGEARAVLERTPIARPVIYTLAGCLPGERCIVERTETGARIYSDPGGAANDWAERQPGWEARIGSDELFTRTTEDAALRSRDRRDSLASWNGVFSRDAFSWVVPPVLNKYTRVAVEMCAAHGVLRVIGYERSGMGETADPATLPRELRAA